VQLKENIMKTTVTKWAMKAAGTGAMALLLAAPSFAQSRYDGNRNNNDRGRQTTTDARNNDHRSNDNNGYRENQRVTMSGKVSSFSRERDGYRVQLDRGQSYWVPQSTFGNRARDLRAGISISLGGIFRGGAIQFDAVSWPGAVAYGNGYGYGNGYVRGIVERIDYRNATLVVRDQATGRLITAEMTAGSYGRNIRQGDRVQLTGQWIRGGVFDVSSINRG
jgi:hypothetical protein